MTSADRALHTYAYLEAVQAADLPTIAPWLTATCPECGQVPDDDGTHVVFRGAVLVGCEGFHVVNPNVVGIHRPAWQDWRHVVAVPDDGLTPGERETRELAREILDDDSVDYIAEWERREAIMEPGAWLDLADALEICPVHHCATEICADDKADCAAGRGE